MTAATSPSRRTGLLCLASCLSRKLLVLLAFAVGLGLGFCIGLVSGVAKERISKKPEIALDAAVISSKAAEFKLDPTAPGVGTYLATAFLYATPNFRNLDIQRKAVVAIGRPEGKCDFTLDVTTFYGCQTPEVLSVLSKVCVGERTGTKARPPIPVESMPTCTGAAFSDVQDLMLELPQ